MYKLVQAATLVVAQGGGAASSGVSAFLGHQTLQTLQAFMQQQCQASMAAWPEEESSGEEEQELMRLPGRAVAIKFPEHEMAIAWCVFYQAPWYALCKRVVVKDVHKLQYVSGMTMGALMKHGPFLRICGLHKVQDRALTNVNVPLAVALAANRALTKLSITKNQIGDEGATALADALCVNGAMTDLDLSFNNIGGDGAKALANALRVNGAMTTLLLGGNKIRDEGATALADALHVNGALTSLDLSYNTIGDEGAKALGEALRVNGALTTLW